MLKPFIIPIFIPHSGCPHQCVFCNQRKIAGQETPATPFMVKQTIEEQLTWLTTSRHVEVAFYGGSFTALPWEQQQALLEPAYQARLAGHIQAIRLSTRPDCINEEIVALLKTREVNIVELGVQSAVNTVLQASNRGHSHEDVNRAVDLLKQAGITVGIQLMLGLPGDSWNNLLETALAVKRWQPAFTRIYPTLVLCDTPLAVQLSNGTYTPLSLGTAIQQAAFLKLFFYQAGISVIRTGLQATEELASQSTVLAGPYHPAFGEMVESEIFFWLLQRAIQLLPQTKKHSLIKIMYHPQNTSKVRGIKNAVRHRLERQYPDLHFLWQTAEVAKDAILFVQEEQQYLITKNMLECI